KPLASLGPTASGKSTFAPLMAPAWGPGTWRITRDGRDLRTFARSERPREVAYVSQEAFLFDASVRDNITLGEDFTDEDVWEAAKLAGAREFILELSDGLDTRLGERGANLSGGQRQRLALARALKIGRAWCRESEATSGAR